MTLTENELYRAIQEAMDKAQESALEGPPGATIREIAESLGVTVYRARKRVRKAVEAGELVGERGIRLNILDEVSPTPVYRPARRASE